MTRLLLDRREALAVGSAALAGLVLGATGVFAKATRTIGSFKVTSLSDGHLSLPIDMLAPTAPEAERQAILAKAGIGGAQFKSPLNVTLIESANEKILVDVGSGARFMDTAGKLAEALEAASIDPASITKVVYTHAHPDHVWGTVDDFDELSFPNAAHLISEAEWNFWMAKDILTKLPKERHGFAVGAQRNLKAAKEQITTFKPGEDIVSGLRTIDTAGHTPGHISLELGDGKQQLVVLGDALTHPIISFAHPEWRPATDQEPDKAVATRKRLLDQLATTGATVLGYHLPAPGLGKVVREATGYRFVGL